MSDEFSNAGDELETFGRLVVKTLRDHAIEDFNLLAKGHWKAPSVRPLQKALAKLDAAELAVARQAVVRCVDSAIHAFLFELQEQEDGSDKVEVVVRGQNVAEISDGLQGEPFGKRGWYAKFSKYGESPEVA